MKKILITGGSGLLGGYLQQEGVERYDLYPTHYNGRTQWRQLDITDKVSIYRLFSDFKFDVIIHTAGLGNVDFCERVPRISDLVNYDGTKNLIDILNELHLKPLFVHLSTNAVYDGLTPHYDELSPQYPINKYGHSKKLAEEYVGSHYDKWLIIRPFMLFGRHLITGRDNWLNIIRMNLLLEKPLQLIDDIVWQPTSAKWLAKVIYTLIDNDYYNESFNISQGESMSLYDFGLKICEVWNGDETLLNPVSKDIFVTVAKRPVDTSYDITKIRSVVEIPSVSETLAEMGNE